MTPNRVVAVLTPLVFAPLAGAVAAWLAEHFPGFQVDPGALQEIFIAGALIALAPAVQWLHGWQKYEARQAAMQRDLALGDAMAEPASGAEIEEPSGLEELDDLGELDGRSDLGELDGRSDLGELDGPSDLGELDGPSDLDGPSELDELDELSELDELDAELFAGDDEPVLLGG